MTRKQYQRRMQELVIAVHNDPEITCTGRDTIGVATRRTHDNAKRAAQLFGSYEAAWNCEAVKWLRNRYGM